MDKNKEDRNNFGKRLIDKGLNFIEFESGEFKQKLSEKNKQKS